MSLLLALLALTASSAAAQPKPLDCEASAAHRQFDFWVGHLEVKNAKGQLAGHNRIEKVQKDCALRESWSSAGGGSGESLNYYHPERVNGTSYGWTPATASSISAVG
ncbi:hypothetical protein BST95_00710 [Halioglobus japonicus]|uniref:DUF3617 domain-containing protein n=1 Tax=Halioglobus japonicus TaxID=930805 RepID=A0AAP8MBU2_9GAMM|nr:hypothetical protein [Halioglobus japonicus]AQA16960.1 hypothetical protein BST95_00710 [Halioglobus japonicus]PLW84846.1 hypothetical protein C0029_17775 [Halioglobus japonicus]GHD21722.1 hypothetical protein GCM10007052_32850 [Halioglobus japonicus]